MERVNESVLAVKESTLLGAYANARQWEDEMWLRDETTAPGAMPREPGSDSESEEEDEEEQ